MGSRSIDAGSPAQQLKGLGTVARIEVAGRCPTPYGECWSHSIEQNILQMTRR